VAAGVTPGTPLFVGESIGNQFVGRAFVFSSKCGRFPYGVRGSKLDDSRRLILRGRKPAVGNDCKVRGSTPHSLTFQLIELADKVQHELTSNHPSATPPDQWDAVSKKEKLCMDEVLRRQGLGMIEISRRLRKRFVLPSDQPLADIWAECHAESVRQAEAQKQAEEQKQAEARRQTASASEQHNKDTEIISRQARAEKISGGSALSKLFLVIWFFALSGIPATGVLVLKNGMNIPLVSKIKTFSVAWTVILLAACAVSILFAYYATSYGVEDNQIVRLVLWIGFICFVILTIVVFKLILSAYNVGLLTLLVSTFGAVLCVLLFAGFAMTHKGDGGLFSDIGSLRMFILAGAILCLIFTVVTNVLKTNVLFGIVLTVTQLAFSVLLICVVYALMAARAPHRPQTVRSSLRAIKVPR
jgi:hypothetical protein